MDAEKKRIIITIDGPAGAGKSTVAKAAAERLGLPYLDTGALYRAIAWKLSSEGIAPEDHEKITAALGSLTLAVEGGSVYADGKDVSAELRTSKIDTIVSAYAAQKTVRAALINIQRSQAADGLVADGRDMGTVVFPEAQLKIFLTASAEERARRRFKERLEKEEKADYQEILKQVQDRDRYDMNREISPLRPAPGCVVLDSTEMNAEQVTDAIVSLAEEFEKQENR